MANLPVLNVPDLVAATLPVLGRLKVTDLTRDVQKLPAFMRLFQESQIDYQGGKSIQINALTKPSNNARFKGLYEVDPDLNQDDALDTGQVPWSFADFVWGYDENEMDVNSGEAMIQDYVRLKRYRAGVGWALFFEDWFWATPPSISDTKTPLNLRYWVQKNVTATGLDGTTGGGSFNGIAPSGYTTVGGINPTTQTRWRNYTYKYVDVSDDDLLTKMRTMVRYINFEPIPGLNYGQHAGATPRHEHLMPLKILTAFERLAETRNENLGYDFAVRTPTMGRAPMTWAPQLDNDTDDPIYTIDWSAFQSVLLKGKWMKELPAIRAPRQHSVWLNWVESRWNLICWDRRRLAVGSRAAANP